MGKLQFDGRVELSPGIYYQSSGPRRGERRKVIPITRGRRAAKVARMIAEAVGMGLILWAFLYATLTLSGALP